MGTGGAPARLLLLPMRGGLALMPALVAAAITLESAMVVRAFLPLLPAAARARAGRRGRPLPARIRNARSPPLSSSGAAGWSYWALAAGNQTEGAWPTGPQVRGDIERPLAQAGGAI